MINSEKLENIIKEEISKLRRLGEHERKGSDHLYYRSISKFNMSKIKESVYQEKAVYEVICKYDVYTETEFLHTPDIDEEYTEHYNDLFIIDKDLKLLDVKDIRKIKKK